MTPIQNLSPSARLLSDLKAESIDIVDIRFRIEDEWKIKIDQREMVDSLGKDLTAEEFDARFTVGFIIEYVTRHVAVDRSPA
jgi:acyl carrier protein